MILRIREDIPTTPIELNVQSTGITEKDQLFYIEDDEETEEQLRQRRKEARDQPSNQTTDIALAKFSTHRRPFSQMTTLQKLSNKTTPLWPLNKTTISFYSNLKCWKRNIQKLFYNKVKVIATTAIRLTACPSKMTSSRGTILMEQEAFNAIRQYFLYT